MGPDRQKGLEENGRIGQSKPGAKGAGVCLFIEVINEGKGIELSVDVSQSCCLGRCIHINVEKLLDDADWVHLLCALVRR